jgi:hypothetical protein
MVKKKPKRAMKCDTAATSTVATAKICLFFVVQARAFAPPPITTTTNTWTTTSVSFSLSPPSGLSTLLHPPNSCNYYPAPHANIEQYSSSTALCGIRNFFRKRFGQRGDVEQDDVFLFGLSDIGNATTGLSDENNNADQDVATTERDDELSSLVAVTTTANEAYITPGPKGTTPRSGSTAKSSSSGSTSLAASGSSSALSPKTAITMGALQPPTSTFLVQASEELWSSMAAAAEKTAAPPPAPKVRSSNLRLKRWLPPDFDEPQKIPSKLTSKRDNRRTGNSQFQSQYRDMLEEFSTYTKRDVSHIPNPRMRTIFEGIVASFTVPEILRAFEILYEDYPPLRYGGRLIYRKLKATMMESQIQRQNDISQVQRETGWTADDIDASRIAFLRMAVYDDNTNDSSNDDHPSLGEARFTLQQLIDYDLAETVVEMLGYDYFENFMQDLLYDDEQMDELDEWLEMNIDPKKKGKFKFAFSELMIALQNCPLDSIEPECDPATVLAEIYTRLHLEETSQPQGSEIEGAETTFVVAARSSSVGSGSGNDPQSDDKQQRYSDRYDAMVEDFLQWKDRVSADRQGRKMDVLRGCFAGADQKEIVDALRIVYVDYKPLRFAGDLIFKIMRAVVMSGMA